MINLCSHNLLWQQEKTNTQSIPSFFRRKTNQLEEHILEPISLLEITALLLVSCVNLNQLLILYALVFSSVKWSYCNSSTYLQRFLKD